MKSRTVLDSSSSRTVAILQVLSRMGSLTDTEGLSIVQEQSTKGRL